MLVCGIAQEKSDDGSHLSGESSSTKLYDEDFLWEIPQKQNEEVIVANKGAHMRDHDYYLETLMDESKKDKDSLEKRIDTQEHQSEYSKELQHKIWKETTLLSLSVTGVFEINSQQLPELLSQLKILKELSEKNYAPVIVKITLKKRGKNFSYKVKHYKEKFQILYHNTDHRYSHINTTPNVHRILHNLNKDFLGQMPTTSDDFKSTETNVDAQVSYSIDESDEDDN